MSRLLQLFVGFALQATVDPIFAAGFEDARIADIDFRSFGGTTLNVTTAGNNGNSIVYPANCRSAAYTAGPNEFAVLSATVSASTAGAVSDVLYLRLGRSTTGAPPFSTIAIPTVADSISSVVGSVTAHAVTPLVSGTTYTFAAGIATNSLATFTSVACTGKVEIIRQLN